MGVRAKPPAWRSEDEAKKPNGVANKEPLEHKDLDTISLRVPNTDDLRPGLQTKSASSPQLLRRRVVRHADTQDGDGFEHPLQRVSPLPNDQTLFVKHLKFAHNAMSERLTTSPNIA